MDSPLKARIVQWNREKQYGFLQSGKTRVFVHIRDFAEHHKAPEVGDKILFEMGQDARGRTCAKNAVHVNDGGRISADHLLILTGLLLLPAAACYQWKLDWRLVAGYSVLMSGLAFAFYAADKRRARDKAWRVPELQLHLFELLGGWPGAFLAQRHYRHKCSKAPFQIVFWMIVLTFQFVAFDSLQNWQYSSAAFNALHQMLKQSGKGS